MATIDDISKVLAGFAEDINDSSGKRTDNEGSNN
jgi:hypothetical protein